jgi:hypothetical protein
MPVTEEDALHLQTAVSSLHSTFTLASFRIAILMGEAVRDAARRRKAVELWKSLDEFGHSLGFDPPSDEEHDKRETATVELLEHERAKGFPLHHGLTAIGLWSSLEAYLDDVIAACLFWQPAFLNEAQLTKIRGPLLEFSRLRLSERARHLLERLSSESTTRPGVDRYEDLLKKLGLAGDAIDSDLRRTLVEFYAVRNLFAHRAGIVDKRFCLVCPHFQIEAGDEFLLTQDLVLGYLASAIRYGTIVAKRILDRMGVVDESVEGFYNRTADAVQTYVKSNQASKRRPKAARKKKARKRS